MLVIITMSTSCQQKQNSEIVDLIQPLSLIAGQTDTILVSDLFYAEDYNITFEQDVNVIAKYNRQDEKLVITPNPDFEGQTLLHFQKENNTFSIPLFVKMQQMKKFSHKPKNKPGKITLFGSFNSWNRNNLEMKDDDNDGTYEIEIPIQPGRYEYRFWIDGKEIIDPNNPEKISNPFGEYNSLLTIYPKYNNKSFIHILGMEKIGKNVKLKFQYENGEKNVQLKPEHLIALINNQQIPEKNIILKNDRININLSNDQLKGEKTIRLSVAQNEKIAPLKTVMLNNGAPLSPNENNFKWNEGVLYSIMIDRFKDGDPQNNSPVKQKELSPKANYKGGDLQGILQKIEEGYFNSLGVNVLWLSPVNENTNMAFREYPEPHKYFSAYHGYWPVHHQKVEEKFGSMSLLQKLVKTAHDHNIKVILDFVSNHTHIDHPFFKEHRDWYGKLDLPDGRKNIRFWDEYRLTTWFDTFLPSFDYLNSEEALNVMTDNAVWWLKQANFDGFRHDAVKHIPNKFWRVLTQKVKREVEIPQNRKLYQIGETFGSYELISSYVNNGQLSAQFNFNLFETARYVILKPEASFEVLDTELNKTFDVYGQNHLMGNLMDSHDKVRFMAYADDDITFSSGNAEEIGWNNPPKVDDVANYKKARLYMAYMLTIPGVPTLYYGDEIGMTGAADPDNRRMMRFGKELSVAENEMMKKVSWLIKLRRNHSALCYGDFQTLLADEKCYAYLRSDMNERILIVLNKGNAAEKRETNIPEIYNVKSAIDLITGDDYKIVENQLKINIPETGWKILKLK